MTQRKWLAALALLTLHAAPAGAACFDNGYTDPPPTAATITGPARVSFVQGPDETPGCPNDTPACRARAFVVPGDAVLVAPGQGPYACAAFATPKGPVTTGYLPTAALSPLQTTASDWPGTWKRIESTITIKPAAKSGQFHIQGDATWGASDPARVKRGGVNIGEIDATAAPDANGLLAFTMGDTATLPYTGGDDTDCRVRMLRRGPYLAIDDNGNCGGHNVSFSGLYRRE